MSRQPALTVSHFLAHGVLQELPLSGPHALRDYCRRCAAVSISRYHTSGRRMTRRGAVELTLTLPDGTRRTVTVRAHRTPQPLPLWHIYEYRGAYVRGRREYGAAADPGVAATMARSCVADGAFRAEVISPAGDVALIITPDMLTETDWIPAGTIEPETDGSYLELAAMPTPQLRLEPQAVPLKQASLI
jgi:hypothetical protein